MIALLMATRRRGRRDELLDKVVAITGGSRGLGLALSEACVAAGAQVVMVARNHGELDSGRQQLIRAGFAAANIHVYACDIVNETQVQEMMRWIESSVGPVDVLINNAGVIHVGPVETQTLEAFEDAMGTNFFGALHCTRAVLPSMLQRGDGHIVNIASIGGLVSVPHLLPYSASKFALVGFSRGLAIELQGRGIRVLTVCPWLMRTGSHLQAFFSGKRDEEYRWFSVGATLPVVAMGPRQAAGQILRAVLTGQKELLVSWWSVIASLVTRFTPFITSTALTVADRFLLPAESSDQTQAAKGFQVRDLEWKAVSRFGSEAANDWNQKS